MIIIPGSVEGAAPIVAQRTGGLVLTHWHRVGGRDVFMAFTRSLRSVWCNAQRDRPHSACPPPDGLAARAGVVHSRSLLAVPLTEEADAGWTSSARSPC
jgi:hypothetical protein